MSKVFAGGIIRPVYICDPEKNTSYTTDKEFAKTGENNKPIAAVRSDMEAEE